MVQMPSLWSRRLAVLLLSLLGPMAGCGRSDSLVVVHVAGLVPTITELYVTMKLDGTTAKNTQPLPESGTDAFVVHQQMERFGIQVPTGSSSLALSIKGFDTNRVVVRTGEVTWSLAQGQDVDVTLVVPTP